MNVYTVRAFNETRNELHKQTFPAASKDDARKKMINWLVNQNVNADDWKFSINDPDEERGYLELNQPKQP